PVRSSCCVAYGRTDLSVEEAKRMKRVIVNALVIALAFAPSIVWAATTTLVASKDATMYADAPDNSAGGAPGFYVGGNGSGSARRSLLAFDVATSVPAGSTITSAELTLHVGRQSSANAL